MANNRMALICNICEPKWETMPPKAGFILGKWYPGGTQDGGYGGSGIDGDRLELFIIQHSHNNIEFPLRLEYEIKPTDADEEEIRKQALEHFRIIKSETI